MTFQAFQQIQAVFDSAGLSMGSPAPQKSDAPFRGERGVTMRQGSLWGHRPSHIVVVRVAADVADEQHHRGVTEILPPVRSPLGLGTDLAGLVVDRARAVAGIFDD